MFINLKQLAFSVKIESCVFEGYEYFEVKSTPKQGDKVGEAFKGHDMESVDQLSLGATGT
jgi:hypothetical protein